MRLIGQRDERSGDDENGLFAASDASLLRRIASGNRDAFTALYKRYQRRLFCYFVKMIRDEATAEGLTNDVMFEVWRYAKTYKGRSSVSTWMLGIAHHKALDELRKKHEEPAEPEALFQLADPRDLADNVAHNDLAQLLKNALSKLSAEHREVLELTYYQGLSIEEIGQITDSPGNTVKTRMFYARQKLKQILSSTGVTKESL